MKEITIKLDDNLHYQLKFLSTNADISINEYITKLISNDLKERKELLMDSIISENREALEELAK